MDIPARTLGERLAPLFTTFILFGGLPQLQAGILIGTFSSITAGSNVDLTASGKLDWVHWGLYTDSSLNRKAGVTPLIGNFVLVGDINSYPVVYQYADNANGYTWYDGAPVASVTNTTTGVWAYAAPVAQGSGFELTVSADTMPRTLQMFVGAYQAKGQFTASLSDNSAPAFTSDDRSTVNNSGSGPGGVFAITYAADSPGQMLTVQWTLVQGHGPDANVTSQAAALTVPGADSPPYIILTSPTNSASFPEPASITLQANAQDFDGTVTNVSFYAGTNKLGQTSASPYRFDWSNVTRGYYTVTATATDDAGVTSSTQPVEVFVYGSGGRQSNAVAASPLAVDLTSEGTADWAHWGSVTNTSFDYKAVVPRQISNFTVLGTNAVECYTDNFTAFSWSDGTPLLATNGTPTGVFITGMSNGFSLTTPADWLPRTLRLYVGGYGVQGKFQAYLSDLSASPYTDTSVSNVYGNSFVVYTIHYRAASLNQQLNVVYRALNEFDLTYGNVTLQAATLQSGPPEPLPVQLLDPILSGSYFLFSFVTQSNFNYAIQTLDSLSTTNWRTVTTVPGRGATIIVLSQVGGVLKRFYRVQTQ